MNGKRARRSWGARAAFTALLIQAGPLGAGLLVWAHHSEQRRAPGVVIQFQVPGGIKEIRSLCDRSGSRLVVLDGAARMAVLQMRGLDIYCTTVPAPTEVDPRLDYTVALTDINADGLIDLSLYRCAERENDLLLVARREGERFLRTPPPAHLRAGSTRRPTVLHNADGTTLGLDFAAGRIATRLGLPGGPTCQVVPGLPVVVADLDDDGAEELVTVDVFKVESDRARIRLFAFVGDRLQQVWETRLTIDRALQRATAEGPGTLITDCDIDGDGRAELVIATCDGLVRVHRWYGEGEAPAASPRRPRLRNI